MKVLFAGASGTLGRSLVPQLLAAGHEVIGLTRHPLAAERLRALGVRPITLDVLDRGALLPAVRELRIDAVLHQLTALSSAPTHHRSMRATNILRTEGTRNLVEAARVSGARRIVTQSIVFGYGFGRHPGTLDERAPFGVPAGDATDDVVEALVEGARMPRRRMLPTATSGGAVPLIHHDDAAAATVAALERGEPGAAYNIADDDPGQTWRGYLVEAASALGAPAPLALPAAVLRAAVPYAARIMAGLDLRVSSERAHRELGWAPRYPSAREGWRAELA